MVTVAPDDSDITAWALAARAGDTAAATALVRATQASVRRFLAHLVSAQEAEDLAQETYLRAMRSLPGFAARSSARTWLLAIARRVAADHFRAIVARPRAAALDDWQLAVEATQARGGGFDDAVVLRELLGGLAPERREAFVATQVVGLTYAEAAEVCDCPVGTIRSRVARAREDLVRALEETGGTGRRDRGRGAADGRHLRAIG